MIPRVLDIKEVRKRHREHHRLESLPNLKGLHFVLSNWKILLVLCFIYINLFKTHRKCSYKHVVSDNIISVCEEERETQNGPKLFFSSSYCVLHRVYHFTQFSLKFHKKVYLRFKNYIYLFYLTHVNVSLASMEVYHSILSACGGQNMVSDPTELD